MQRPEIFTKNKVSYARYCCIDMLDVTASYGRPFDFTAFLGIFIRDKKAVFEIKNLAPLESTRMTHLNIPSPYIN